MLKEKLIEIFTSPGFIGMYIFIAVRIYLYIAKKTKNKIDDLVGVLILNVFNFVEKGNLNDILKFFGIKPESSLKIEQALEIFNFKYKEMFGNEAPENLKVLAQKVWAERAYWLKKTPQSIDITQSIK